MKKRYFYWFLCLLLLSGAGVACRSNKTGCPINEQASSGVDKKGNLLTKRGSSSLFGKEKKYKKRKKH